MVDAAVLAALLDVATAAGVVERRDAMFAGERINVTEDRAVLQIALRAPRGTVIELDGHDVVADVHAVLDRMAVFAGLVRDGTWTGATGERIRTVVSIGIGGSDLGPAMAYRALAAYHHPELTGRFVSNVDGADIVAALDGLDPAATLFVVSSKTSTTIETLNQRRHGVGLAGRRARRGRRRPSTSSPSARTRPRSPPSASTRPTCSASGTGSAAATRSTRRSACRS